MLVTMAAQLKELLIMMICGFLLAFLYDCLRFSRRICPHSLFYISFEDALFWLFGAAAVFTLVLWLDFGQIRLFMLFGVLIGTVLYYALISPVFLKISVYAARLIQCAVRVLLRPILYVFRQIAQKFEFFVNFIKKLLKKYLKCFKITLCSVFKHIRVIIKKH